ncbi:MAG: glycosyl transferase, family 2, partial [Bryobacterales bacterium]|nr:glycosyl transferase, family 2 [Bryobacterales bacterium]
MPDEVSVIVPVWNGRAMVERLIGSLRGQTYPIAEILIVDNGSVDGAPEAAEQLGARVIRMGSNTGFSRAVNRGIKECNTDWLAIVNSDVTLAPDWLELLIAAARQPDIWFAAGKILNESRRELIDGTYDALCRGGCAWRLGHGRPDGREFSHARDIWFAPGTASLFRAELFRQLGSFDERFESYLEDVELGLRCVCLDYHGRYVPAAIAYHTGSASLGQWHPETVRRISRNQVLLIAKYYPARALFRWGWPILLAQTLWGLVALRHGTFRAFVRGKLEGLTSFRTARLQ